MVTGGESRVCVCVSAGVSSDLSRVLHFIALTALSWAHVVPSFRLSLGRKLGHATCQLRNKRYCSWRLLSHSEEVGAVSHLPPKEKKAPPLPDQSTFQLVHGSVEAMMERSSFSYLNGQNHPLQWASKRQTISPSAKKTSRKLKYVWAYSLWRFLKLYCL